MTKITNTSAGPRGIHTEDGMVVLAPGETRDDLKLSEAELKSAEDGDWFHVGDMPKPKAAADGDTKALKADLKAAQDALAASNAERDAEKVRADAAEAKVAELTAALDAATKPKDAGK